MSEEKKYHRRKVGNHILQPETLMMSYGFDPALSEGAVKIPVFQSSTFVFPSAQDGKDYFDLATGKREPNVGEEGGLIYSRLNNPNLQVLEERLCLWDDAEMALSFSSGMAAISNTILTFARPGDTIVYSQPVYGGTGHLIEEVLPEMNITGFGFEAGKSNAHVEEVVRAALKKGPVSLIFAETPANPTNALVDLEFLVKMADLVEKETGNRPPVAIDNTFLGPLWQRPLDHGCDLVLYSMTKYVGGHSDLIAGAVSGSKEMVSQIAGIRMMLGSMTDPHTAWLIMRSMETLKVRMEASTRSAKTVAEYLRDHPKVDKVHYLGFLTEEDPNYRVYKEQARGAGSTFAFEIEGGEAEAFRFLDGLRIAKNAVSLGGTETLISHPASTTHSVIDPELRDKIGVKGNLVRISIGLENEDDLIADMAAGLANV